MSIKNKGKVLKLNTINVFCFILILIKVEFNSKGLDMIYLETSRYFKNTKKVFM